MKRVVNNRPICFFALALTLGLFIAGKCLPYAGARVLTVAVAVIVAGFLMFFNKTKLVYLPVAVVLGVMLISGAYGIYQTKRIDIEKAEFSATISSEIVEREKGYCFEVENVTADGRRVKGGATVYVFDLPEARAGDKVTFGGEIISREFKLDGSFLSNYKNGNYHLIFADDVEGGGAGELKFSTRLRVSLKRALYNTVDEDTAGITCALLLGDKYGIGDELYDNVKDSGLSHIFAVSGLHIGILAGVFLGIAKLLKLRGVKRFLLVVGATVVYGALCGFPSSVVRAIIMTAVFLLADTLCRQRDNLNNLALAAIIVLFFYPTELFAVGFRMSFLAVLALIVLEPPVEKRLKFLPKGVRQIVAASLAVNVFLYPIMAETFGAFQTLFVLSNIVILPILPFIFTFSLIICGFALIIPAASPVLLAQTVIVWPIKLVSATVGTLAISSVSAPALGVGQIAFYFVILWLSRYVFLPKKIKYPVAACALTLGVTATLLQGILL